MDNAPPWVDRILAELDAADRRAQAVAGGLTPSQLNWRPAPEAWSVGQCLAHLLAANQVYLPPMASALDTSPPSTVQAITPGWFGRWFIRTAIEPSPTSSKARAPKKIEPAPEVDGAILDAFLRSNQTARELVRRASAHDVNRIRFRNPFVPLLRFTVGTGLEIVWKHQVRHLLQAERVRESPNFPAA